MNGLNHRYLEPELLEELFSLTQQSRHRVIEEPRCEIIIDPRHEEITLVTAAVGPEPDVAKFSRIRLELADDAESPTYELSIDATDAHFEAYSILTAVVDELFEGASFARATSAALSNYKALVRGKAAMTPEQQHGLYGELLVMRHLIHSLGETAAVSAWLGPDNEQHDFVFATFDAECKTTTSERRLHTIGTVMQLEPNPDRELWLLSVQITRGGLDSGESLTELINSIGGSLCNSNERFHGRLQRLGWRSEDADMYSQKFMLRSRIQGYPVTPDFPAITNGLLKPVVPEFNSVSDITYRIDVTQRQAFVIPAPLASINDSLEVQ